MEGQSSIYYNHTNAYEYQALDVSYCVDRIVTLPGKLLVANGNSCRCKSLYTLEMTHSMLHLSKVIVTAMEIS